MQTVVYDRNLVSKILQYTDAATIARLEVCCRIWYTVANSSTVRATLAQQSPYLTVVPSADDAWRQLRFQLGRSWRVKHRLALDQIRGRLDLWSTHEDKDPHLVNCCQSCAHTIIGHVAMCTKFPEPRVLSIHRARLWRVCCGFTGPCCGIAWGYTFGRILFGWIFGIMAMMLFALPPVMEDDDDKSALTMLYIATGLMGTISLILVLAPFMRSLYLYFTEQTNFTKLFFIESELYREQKMEGIYRMADDSQHCVAKLQQMPNKWLLRFAECLLSFLLSGSALAFTASLGMFTQWKMLQDGGDSFSYSAALAPVVITLLVWSLVKASAVLFEDCGIITHMHDFYTWIDNSNRSVNASVFGPALFQYRLYKQLEMHMWWQLLGLTGVQVFLIGLKLDGILDDRWAWVLSPLIILHPLVVFYAWAGDFMTTTNICWPDDPSYCCCCCHGCPCPELCARVCCSDYKEYCCTDQDSMLARIWPTLIVLLHSVVFHALLVLRLEQSVDISMSALFAILFSTPISFLYCRCIVHASCCRNCH